MRDLIAGFRYAWSGFGLVTRPGVRLYVLVPLLINAALFAAALVLGAGELNSFINHLSERWEWAGWFTWLLWPLFAILACIVFFSCFSLLVNLVASPFNCYLAQAVERHLGVPDNANAAHERGLVAELLREMRAEGQKLIYFAVRALPLLLLFIIPLVAAVAPAVWFLFGAWMLSLEYLDFPLSNHGLLFPEVRERAAQRRALTFGFGCGVLCLTLVPILNFIAVPVAVAGATRMSVERLRP